MTCQSLPEPASTIGSDRSCAIDSAASPGFSRPRFSAMTKRLRTSNQNNEGARAGLPWSPAMTWSAASLCSSGRNQAAATEASTTISTLKAPTFVAPSEDLVDSRLGAPGPRRFDLLYRRRDVHIVGDARQARDRLLTTRDNDVLATFDFGDKVREAGFGLADIDGERQGLDLHTFRR